MVGDIKIISHSEAIDFLLPRHYSGRKPQVKIAFGWYYKSELKAVCTFGKPASPTLCAGVCGKRYSSNVYELNRLCRTDDWEYPLSYFVAYCLRELKKRDWIIVSYSDTAMNHHGYIYQACNFMYTGCTKKRTDMYTPEGTHPRHYKKQNQGEYRKVRSPKHRYVYFCTYNKKLKKEWLKALRYSICKYPKGDNKNYILGQYLQDIIIEDKRNKRNEKE